MPKDGLGLARRAVILALVTWAPMAIWALLNRRALPGVVAEPLLAHFALQARCLVAIPLLVLAEGVAHGVTTRLVPHFLSSGLVPPEDRAHFRAIVERILRLRNATLPGSSCWAWWWGGRWWRLSWRGCRSSPGRGSPTGAWASGVNGFSTSPARFTSPSSSGGPGGSLWSRSCSSVSRSSTCPW